MIRLLLTLSFIVLLLTISCTDNTTGTVDDTDTQIALSGYVKDKNNSGLPNLTVRIINTNFSDITDNLGAYSIVVPKDTIVKYNIDITTLGDSIEILDGQNIIQTIPINNWISEIPTQYYIQRDIYGGLLTDKLDNFNIQAIITTYTENSSYVDTFSLFYNSVGFSYSSFVYFNEEANDTGYSVQVGVFDTNNHLTGISSLVTFTKAIGNVRIPDFNPFNAVPGVLISDSISVFIGDTVSLNATAIDSLEGAIINWAWSIDSGHSFINVNEDSSSGVYSYSTYSFIANLEATDSFPIIAKVIDNDSNETLDTIYLQILDTIVTYGKALIPAKNSSFLMGSSTVGDSASPIHTVQFTYNFYMDTAEVTQKLYDSIMSLTYPTIYVKPAWDSIRSIGDNFPAYRVNWYDAVLYCNALSKQLNLDTAYQFSSISGSPGQYCTLVNLSIDTAAKSIRLPNEAEWEFAARGGSTELKYWGNLADSLYCWHWNEIDSPSEVHSYEVAQKLPNSYGLYDMLGNVWEWVNDWWASSYPSETQIDPVGPGSGLNKIIRGWSSYDMAEQQNGVARRPLSPASGEFNKGFRTVIIE